MRALLYSFAILLILQPTAAFACDTLDIAGPESTCVVGIKHANNRGVWFEMSAAQDVLRKLRLFPELELQVQKHSFSASLADREIKELRAAIDKLETSNRTLQRQVELSTKDAREARESAKGHWYTSPVFWGIAMFITGAAVQHACCGPGK